MESISDGKDIEDIEMIINVNLAHGTSEVVTAAIAQEVFFHFDALNERPFASLAEWLNTYGHDTNELGD